MVSPETLRKLSDYFERDLVLEIRVEEGNISNNYIVNDGQERYFLKQYSKTPKRVAIVQQVEEYMRSRGIPAIAAMGIGPQKMMVEEDKAWSLYPYVEGKSLGRRNLTPEILVTMAKMLARIHQISLGQGEPFEMGEMVIRDRAEFENKILQIEEVVRAKANLDDFDRKTLEGLEIKRLYADNLPPLGEFLPAEKCILHGDYQLGNMFFSDSGEIEHIFDWELTKYAPRIFEVIRSLEIVCFDPRYASDDNYELAKIYLNTYHELLPINTEELARGYKLMIWNKTMDTWVEDGYYLKNNARVAKYQDVEIQRITHLNTKLTEHLDRLVACL